MGTVVEILGISPAPFFDGYAPGLVIGRSTVVAGIPTGANSRGCKGVSGRGYSDYPGKSLEMSVRSEYFFPGGRRRLDRAGPTPPHLSSSAPVAALPTLTGGGRAASLPTSQVSGVAGETWCDGRDQTLVAGFCSTSPVSLSWPVRRKNVARDTPPACAAACRAVDVSG